MEENKGKAMMIVIISLLLVLIIAIAGVSVLAFKMLKSREEGNDVSTTSITQTKTLDAADIYTYKLPTPIAVNLATGIDGMQHSASVEIGIGIDNTDKKESPTFITLIESQEVIVRDIVISVLRTKTVEEMSAFDSQEAIKQEILDKLRAEFNSDLIYSVYFGTYYYD